MRLLSKSENSIGSSLTKKQNLMAIYGWLMKVVRTMDIRLTASFVSKCPGRWSEPY
jgi:hypothetical protein